LRVLAEVRPTWAILENPPGIRDLFEFGVQLKVDDRHYTEEEKSSGRFEVGRVCEREGTNVLDTILGDIETLGYAVKTVAIPACAVGSPQRRNRYWIVCKRLAKSASRQCDTRAESDREITAGHDRQEQSADNADGSGEDDISLADSARGENHVGEHGDLAEAQGCRQGGDASAGCGGQGDMEHAALDGLREAQSRPDGERVGASTQSCDMADTSQPGREGAKPTCGEDGLYSEHHQSNMADAESINRRSGASRKHGPEYGNNGAWSNFVWTPCADRKVRRSPDDSIVMAHGLPVELLEELGTEGRQTPEDCAPHRSLLGALGNSIVPQVATQIIKAMIDTQPQDESERNI